MGKFRVLGFRVQGFRVRVLDSDRVQCAGLQVSDVRVYFVQVAE